MIQIQILGIEFYYFVSYSGVKDRGSTCKPRNARRTFQKFTRESLSLELNFDIYTLSEFS